MTPFLEHATGIVALGTSLTGMLHRSDRALRRSGSVSSVLWAANNFFLGATTAAAQNLLTVGWMATAAATRDSKRIRFWSCSAFILAIVAAAAATWHGWPSILTTVASIAVTAAVFYWSGAKLRWVMLISALLWSYNAWATHSVEQIAANCLGILGTAISVWRVRRSEQPQSAPQGSAARCSSDTPIRFAGFPPPRGLPRATRHRAPTAANPRQTTRWGAEHAPNRCRRTWHPPGSTCHNPSTPDAGWRGGWESASRH